MALTNAEKQRRWRERRNALAKDAERLRNQEGPGLRLRLQLDPLHIELLDLHAEYLTKASTSRPCAWPSSKSRCNGP